jgi:putative chitinase
MMDSTIIAILQGKLSHAGYDPGSMDGALGPKTYAALFSYMARRALGDRGAALGKGAVAHFAAFDITTPLRIAHWMAQATHETGGFRNLHELWGPTEDQKGYEGASRLGNTVKGDGYLYRGRGVFQLTGRGNYIKYGKLIGRNLVDHPELAEDPEVSVLIACAYWKGHGLNDLADADDVESITRRINGGLNGFKERKEALARAKLVLL